MWTVNRIYQEIALRAVHCIVLDEKRMEVSMFDSVEEDARQDILGFVPCALSVARHLVHERRLSKKEEESFF